MSGVSDRQRAIARVANTRVQATALTCSAPHGEMNVEGQLIQLTNVIESRSYR
jgi:hypothetical protein